MYRMFNFNVDFALNFMDAAKLLFALLECLELITNCLHSGTRQNIIMQIQLTLHESLVAKVSVYR